MKWVAYGWLTLAGAAIWGAVVGLVGAGLDESPGWGRVVMLNRRTGHGVGWLCCCRWLRRVGSRRTMMRGWLTPLTIAGVLAGTALLGSSPQEVSAQVVTPAKITGLTLVSVTHDSMTLSWDPEANSNEYQVRVQYGGSYFFRTFYQTTVTIDTGLDSDVSYDLSVLGKNRLSDGSTRNGPSSDVLNVTTLPLTCTAQPGYFELRHDPSETGNRYYRIRPLVEGRFVDQYLVDATGAVLVGLPDIDDLVGVTVTSLAELVVGTEYEAKVYVSTNTALDTDWVSCGALRPAPRRAPFYTLQWPVFNSVNVAPASGSETDVVVELRWSGVDGANSYRVVRRADGETVSTVGTGSLDFDARWYRETVAATGERVDYQVQAAIDGGANGATVTVRDEERRLEPGEVEYGPFSDTVTLLLSAERNNPLAEGDDLPPDVEGIPPIREFFRTLGETVGVEAERMDGWAVLMWFIFSVGAAATLMAGTSAATGGEFVGPLPMGMGMLAMGLLWGVAGPVYAGVPWQFALTPLALMVVSGIIMARTRRMIP